MLGSGLGTEAGVRGRGEGASVVHFTRNALTFRDRRLPEESH